MTVAIILFIVAVAFVVQSIKVVPHQHAWVVERLGAKKAKESRSV